MHVHILNDVIMVQKDVQQHGLKEGREKVTMVVWSFGEQRTHAA